MSAAMLVITALALAALVVSWNGLRASARRLASAARLRSLYGLLAALLTLRLVVVAVPHPLVVAALMLIAAWLPVATLRLAEELRRRHAPRFVKLTALVGALAFSAVAVTIGLVWNVAAIAALAVWQASVLAAILALLVVSRSDVTSPERRTIDTVLIALLFAVPLVLSDFGAIWPDLPLRGGAFAVLLLVLATSGRANGGGDPAGLLSDALLAFGAGGLVLLAGLTVGPPPTGAGAIVLSGCGTAIGALALLLERARGARGTEPGLIAALAATDAGDRAAILSAHPMLAAGRLLGPRELTGYPVRSVEQLAGHRVISAETGDRECRDTAADLLLATAATHLLRLSRDPPEFLAVVCDGLAPHARDDELTVAARLLETTR